jgi:hypothetical protein
LDVKQFGHSGASARALLMRQARKVDSSCSNSAPRAASIEPIALELLFPEGESLRLMR